MHFLSVAKRGRPTLANLTGRLGCGVGEGGADREGTAPHILTGDRVSEPVVLDRRVERERGSGGRANLRSPA